MHQYDPLRRDVLWQFGHPYMDLCLAIYMKTIHFHFYYELLKSHSLVLPLFTSQRLFCVATKIVCILTLSVLFKTIKYINICTDTTKN